MTAQGRLSQLRLARTLPLLLLVISVLVAAVSCSGSGQEPTAQLDIAMTTGAGVDPALWDELVDELVRVLVQEGTARRTAAAPVGFASRVPDLSTHHVAGETYFTWSYRQHGDYDLNGDVNVSDLTQVGVHFGKTTLSADWQQAQLADGDGNGEVNVSDVTPIGQNFGGRVSGYELQVRQDSGSPWAKSSEHAFIPGDKLTGIYPEYTRVSPSILPGPQYRVVPYVDGGGDRQYGVESNLLQTAASGSPWHTHRGNNFRDGLAPVAGPAAITDSWELDIEGVVFMQELAVGMDGLLYAATYTGSGEIDDPTLGGFVYAIDPAGSVSWRFRTEAGMMLTPATCRTGRVIVGDISGIVYCLAPDGKQHWRVQLPGVIGLNSPLVDDAGTVFILAHALGGSGGVTSSTLHKLLPDGTAEWGRQLNDPGLISPFLNSQAQPTVVDNAGELYSYDYQGTLAQNFMLPEPPGAFIYPHGPAIRAGLMVYCSDSDQLRFHMDDDTFEGHVDLGEEGITMPSLNNESKIIFGSRTLDPNPALRINHYTAGIEDWEYAISGTVVSDIAIDSEDRMFYGTWLASEVPLTNGVYCLEPDQTIAWYFPTDEWAATAVTIAGENLLACVLLEGWDDPQSTTKVLGIRGD